MPFMLLRLLPMLLMFRLSPRCLPRYYDAAAAATPLHDIFAPPYAMLLLICWLFTILLRLPRLLPPLPLMFLAIRENAALLPPCFHFDAMLPLLLPRHDAMMPRAAALRHLRHATPLTITPPSLFHAFHDAAAYAYAATP